MDPLSPRERQRLDDDGYLALEGLVEPGRVRAMLTRLGELLAVTEQGHAGTLIAGGLLDEPVFDAAWHHPRVLAAVRQVLGDDHRMLGLASRGLRPGHGQQALHVDWGGQGTPGVWYACHAICAWSTSPRGTAPLACCPARTATPGCSRTSATRGGRTRRSGSSSARRGRSSSSTSTASTRRCRTGRTPPGHALFAHFSRRDSPLLLADPHAAPGPETLARFDEETRAILVT